MSLIYCKNIFILSVDYSIDFEDDKYVLTWQINDVDENYETGPISLEEFGNSTLRVFFRGFAGGDLLFEIEIQSDKWQKWRINTDVDDLTDVNDTSRKQAK